MKFRTFFAIIFITVLTTVNTKIISSSNSGNLSLEELLTVNKANAEISAYPNWYVTFPSSNDITCYNGGYYCCPVPGVICSERS